MLPTHYTQSRSKWATCLPPLFVLLVFLSSCSTVLRVEHASKLQEAQDLFNEASEMENALKTEAITEGFMPLDNRIDATYRTSHAMVSSLIREQRAAMTTDNILGTAYTLKALIEWRLEDYSSALHTVREVDSLNVNIFPRDEALLSALPSLISNDTAKQLMDSRSENLDTVATLLNESINGLHALTDTIPSMNSMRLYFLTSQLAALKNWNDLLDKPKAYVKDSHSFDSLQKLRGTLCSQVTDKVWTNFTTEVNRLNSAKACNTYNYFFDLLGPEGCRQNEVQSKDNCENKN